MAAEISNDRRELMRLIASDGVKIETLKIKVAKLPHGQARNAAVLQLGVLLKAQDARLLRIRGLPRG